MKGRLDSKRANQIITFLLKEANKENLGIAAAIADEHGELLAFSRTDPCGLASIRVAIAKSYTAARLQKSTRKLYEEGFELANLGDSRYTMYPGGFPIKDNDLCLGGIGISGLTPEEDEKLALLGIAYYHDN